MRGSGGIQAEDNRFDEDAVEPLPQPAFGAKGGAVVVAAAFVVVVAVELAVVDRGRPPSGVADHVRWVAGERRRSGPPAGEADGDCFDDAEDDDEHDGTCVGVEPETGFVPYQSSGAK